MTIIKWRQRAKVRSAGLRCLFLLACLSLLPGGLAACGPAMRGLAPGLPLAAKKLVQVRYALNSPALVGGLFTVAVNSATTTFGDDNTAPGKGMIYVVLHVTLHNVSKQPVAITSTRQFSLLDSNGRDYPLTEHLPLLAPNTLLLPGQQAQGEFAFETPLTIHRLILNFSADLLNNAHASWNIQI